MSKHRAFKGTERAVAKILGGKRLGHLGGVDVKTRWVSVEVKHRQSLPAWLTDAMAQTKRHAEPEQLPIVVLHVEGQRHSENMVVMRLSDFQAWFGELDEALQRVSPEIQLEQAE
jgi:hypothetical protein